MRVEQIFKKNIHRNINGVVQAGQLDKETIKNELEEYVMTEEGTYYLEMFYKNYLAVYNHPSTNIGIWISGFFGSGKSHFLKILSYLLDNKAIDGKKPVEYFTEKTKNENLLSMMRQVSEKDSDAILFNIDSKSSSSTTQKERIVEVFLRVFNHHLGYSDTLWVAEMERQLDEERKLSDFKDNIRAITEMEWETVRLKAVLRRKKIIEALVQSGYDEETASRFFDVSKNTFEMTSERLSQLIADYCRKRGADYRLVLLVDEVGQYIGTDSNLMLNLQTVVEDIGNRCRGQAWVIVTSQEKIESVTNLHSTNDFSKIQGRFATRINLSSSNTDEVIKRRLLEKTNVAEDTLKTMYAQEEQMIRNRLAFDQNSTQLRSGYRSADEFVALYPFVPYQVELLQKVFNKIRTQGEGGASLAHGERSLLKGFQEAAQLNATEEVSNMVTLAEFFPSIRGFLESTITSTISRAEDRAKNQEGLTEEDIPVLKVLYMIKGIDEIKATSNNLATLLMETIHDERQPLEYRVKESLNRLQQAMLIEQRADGTYSFLSDEEQEINKEIRVEEVNDTLIKQQLGDLFFGKMYSKAKYEYKKESTSILFEFNKRFDNYTKGQMTYPLTLQVYSGRLSDADAALRANSGHLIICLDEELLAEAESALRYIEQVQKYVTRKRNPNSTPTQNKIYDAKLGQIDDFAEKALELMNKSCQKARFFIQGQERSFKGDFENQVNNALEMLVRNTYTKLEYIESPIPFKNHKDVWKQLAEQGTSEDLFGYRSNQNAYEELKYHVDELARFHDKETLKSMVDRFNSIPFGWSELDVIGLILVLMRDGKVKLTYAGDPFVPDSAQFYDRLTRISERERIVVFPILEMDRQVKKDAIALIRDFFDQQVSFDTYDDFAKLIKEELKSRFENPLDDMRIKRRQASSEYPYPGDSEIHSISTGIQKLLHIHDSEQLVREFINCEDQIEEWTGQLDTLKGFYGKVPNEKFDEAVQTLLQYKQDILITQNEEVKTIHNRIAQILVNPRPYREIPQLPDLLHQLKENLQREVEEQRRAVLLQVEAMEMKVQQLKDYYSREETIVQYIETQTTLFEGIKESIQTEQSIMSLRARLQQLNEISTKIRSHAQKMEEDLRKATSRPAGGGQKQPTVIREKKPKRLRSQELYQMFFHGVNKIETQSDLEQAIEKLRENLLRELKDHILEIED